MLFWSLEMLGIVRVADVRPRRKVLTPRGVGGVRFLLGLL